MTGPSVFVIKGKGNSFTWGPMFRWKKRLEQYATFCPIFLLEKALVSVRVQ